MNPKFKKSVEERDTASFIKVVSDEGLLRFPILKSEEEPNVAAVPVAVTPVIVLAFAYVGVGLDAIAAVDVYAAVNVRAAVETSTATEGITTLTLPKPIAPSIKLAHRFGGKNFAVAVLASLAEIIRKEAREMIQQNPKKFLVYQFFA